MLSDFSPQKPQIAQFTSHNCNQKYLLPKFLSNFSFCVHHYEPTIICHIKLISLHSWKFKTTFQQGNEDKLCYKNNSELFIVMQNDRAVFFRFWGPSSSLIFDLTQANFEANLVNFFHLTQNLENFSQIIDIFSLFKLDFYHNHPF